MAHRRVRSDDGELLDLARAGDRAAFSELVRIHQDEVFTLAVRLVSDRELAADVSQEAFVRAWRALPNFRGDAKFLDMDAPDNRQRGMDPTPQTASAPRRLDR